MKYVPALLSALLFAGCWTFNETPYPAVEVTPAAETTKSIALTGFETTVTEWETVHGYRTVCTPDYGCYRYGTPGFFQTVPSVDYVPQRHSTDMFLRRAQDLFEKFGFTIAPTGAVYTVDVCFETYLPTSADTARKIAWNVCTLFFCSYDTSKWVAKLRIREAKTGKLVFTCDYDQVYETCVFGLVPVFGAASATETDPVQMQTWCLSALTDRAVAGATAFLK